MRLDLFVKDKLNISRQKAREIIEQGLVTIDNKIITKPSYNVNSDANISIGSTESILKYVGRGGYKLEKAIEFFNINLKNFVCIDIGASTGGFTDCMLQNGAVKVYAIDVGHGQLDWKLRNDERVVCMERTNIRYVTPDDLQEPADFSSIDVSFISLTKVLLPVYHLLKSGGEVVCLIKPQFEAGREKVGKKGVVRDAKVHQEVIEKVMEYAKSIGFAPQHLEFSPIKGPEGNIEYLLHIVKTDTENPVKEQELSIQNVVALAHAELDK